MRFYRLPVLLLAAAWLSGCAAGEPPAPPLPCLDCNVLLISIDTLRADHLSLYGYERPTSPNLEALAAEAVVFEEMVNNGGGTLPVHMSMLTSLPPRVHNVLPNSDRMLEPERVTLAEQLQAAGLVTAAFTDAGWMRGKFGFSQGFDLYDDEGGRLARILPKALDWLEESKDSRFFLFLHTYDVHSEWKDHPYSCPGEYPERYWPDYDGGFTGCLEGKCASQLFLWFNQQIKSDPEFDLGRHLTAEDLAYEMARYDGCINYVDDKLKILFDRLRELGLWDKTLVAITSDHGEEFLEHGRLLHQNAPFEVMIHVPLVIKFPGGLFGGRRVGHLATTIDLMPTILEVLGIGPNPQILGTSLLPTLTDGRPVRRAAHVYRSIRTPRWKLIEHNDGRWLFDLDADPGETVDVADREPELVARMLAESDREAREDRRLFRQFKEDKPATDEKVELTPEEIDNLRALGYIK